MRNIKSLNKAIKAIELAKVVGRDIGKSHILIFCGMAYHWIFSKINPSNYILYDFAYKKRKEKKEYLSKRQMDSLQLKLNPTVHTKLADNKLFFYDRCIKKQIPTPKIIGVIAWQKIFLPDNIPVINTADRLNELFNKIPYTEILFKPIDGGHGACILILEKRGSLLIDKKRKSWKAEELLKYCKEKGHDSYGNKSSGFLIQEFIHPDERLKCVMPGPALGTIRVNTVLSKNDIVELFYIIVKIPRKGQIIDNFMHGKTGNLLVGVDSQSGCLMDGWTAEPNTMRMIKQGKHPDTGAIFNTVQIPRWKEVKSIVSSAARAFPELKTLGWDIAVAQKGIFVIEANWHYDPDGPQIVLNRGIKSEIKEYFSKALI